MIIMTPPSVSPLNNILTGSIDLLPVSTLHTQDWPNARMQAPTLQVFLVDVGAMIHLLREVPL